MPRRRYTVTVPPAEAARLRAFDNAREGREHWPIGANRTFLRRDHRTFDVKDWASLGVGKASVVTLGTAALREGEGEGGVGRVDVVVRTRGSWLGWFFVVIGLACFAVVPRDGLGAAALGLAIIAGGWALFLRRPDAETDLDEIEAILRAEIVGDWQPAAQD